MAKKKTDITDCPLQSLKPVKVACPECGRTGFEPARGRFGVIWRCQNRPACKFWLDAQPLGRKCTYQVRGKPCGAMMVEGTKTIPDRCSNRQCPNRYPHKLPQDTTDEER